MNDNSKAIVIFGCNEWKMDAVGGWRVASGKWFRVLVVGADSEEAGNR